MEAAVSPLPDDVAALKALLNAATRRADEAEARLANAKARESATDRTERAPADPACRGACGQPGADRHPAAPAWA